MSRKFITSLGLLFLFSSLLIACAPQVVEGPIGPAGPAGPQGPAGPPGNDASVRLEYVGSEKCGQCHEAAYASFTLTGHASGLTAVDGAAPEFPYDDETGGVDDPPDGTTWADISYVLGGYSWAAVFVDQNGYVVTGDAAKWNFPNEQADLDAAWGAYHSGETLVFDCGECHTTGYRTEGHQGDREGVIGTWAFEGVQCEACHGPGSLHASDPYGHLMKMDRSNQLCGDCHGSGTLAEVSAENGFAMTGEQFDELYNSKHFALQCIACHDPHASSQYADAQVNPHQSIRQECESCHEEQVYSNAERHFTLACTDCHMPPAGLAGQGSAELHIGDLSTHLFSINTDPAAVQFSEDGSAMAPYLTLESACMHCHNDVYATVKSLEELAARASGYHTPPAPVLAEPEVITDTTTTP